VHFPFPSSSAISEMRRVIGPVFAVDHCWVPMLTQYCGVNPEIQDCKNWSQTKSLCPYDAREVYFHFDILNRLSVTYDCDRQRDMDGQTMIARRWAARTIISNTFL